MTPRPTRAARRWLPACAGALLLAQTGAAQSGTSGPADYSNGVLGEDVTFTFQGPPGSLGLWLLSIVPGPTPLPCSPVVLPGSVEPNAGAAIVLQTFTYGVTGEFSTTLPVAPAPALTGLSIYAQGVVLDPFGPCIVGGVSNPLRFGLLPPADAILTIGEMVVPRRAHGFSLLPSGKALLSGGENPDPTNPFPLSSLELYDPLREEFQLLGISLTAPRARHEATELLDGSVLLTGGIGAGGAVLASAELYRPANESVLPVPPMSVPRVHHQATLLDDGRVLVTGGFAGPYNPLGPFGFPASFPTAVVPADTLASVAAEIFDPVTLTWSPAPQGFLSRMGHRASKLANGHVLITGGAAYEAGSAKLVETPRVEIWDPVSGQLQVNQVPGLARVFHAQVAKIDGGALVTAGAKLQYDDLSFQLPPLQNGAVAIGPPSPGGGLGTIAIDVSPHDPSPLAQIICVPVGQGNARYYEIACPDPPPWPPLGDVAGSASSNGQTVYRFNPLTNTWEPVATLVYQRPAHAALYFEATDRAVVTGSAWPTPRDTIGFDRTAEVFTLPD